MKVHTCLALGRWCGVANAIPTCANVTTLGLKAETYLAQSTHGFLILQEMHVAADKASALSRRLRRLGWAPHLLGAIVSAQKDDGATSGTRGGLAILAKQHLAVYSLDESVIACELDDPAKRRWHAVI